MEATDRKSQGPSPRELAQKLVWDHRLSKEEYKALLAAWEDPEVSDLIGREALTLRKSYYGDGVFIRGLIEISNYCRNNCYYCGIRRDNPHVDRYRLGEEEILSCCRSGYRAGFRTFVLQGGEDAYYNDERLVGIVSRIRQEYPDCAITLSLGERSRDSYQRLFDAGADRYLLRHETADRDHYHRLHPPELSWSHRMECLRHLKEIGYQTGAGMMVGSPGQTMDNLADDLVFLQDFKPQMVGIGPFIPHHDTIFAGEAGGSVALTLFLLSVIRIILPSVLLPATTALGTLDPQGREKGLVAGANVIMPNLSPEDSREKYELYDRKNQSGEGASGDLAWLEKMVASVGCRLLTDRGDYREEKKAKSRV